MKQIILVIGLFLLLTICNTVFADTATLIDFTLLSKDFPADKPVYNRRTALNFSEAAGVGFTEEDKRKMLVSMGLDEWKIDLASSSKTTMRMKYTKAIEARTAANASPFNGEEMKDKTILGVRIMFPESSFNSYAVIKPPFEVQAYQDKKTHPG